jgi:hypothetical protein
MDFETENRGRGRYVLLLPETLLSLCDHLASYNMYVRNIFPSVKDAGACT